MATRLNTPHPLSQPRRTWKAWWQNFALNCGWFFFLYLLSIGPAYWTWYEATYLDGPIWIQILYLPLVLICELCPPLGWLVNGYISWWIL